MTDGAAKRPAERGVTPVALQRALARIEARLDELVRERRRPPKEVFSLSAAARLLVSSLLAARHGRIYPNAEMVAIRVLGQVRR